MSYLLHMQRQTAWLHGYAKQLDERGYCVLVHYLNTEGGPDNDNLYRYLVGAVEPFLKSFKQHPVIVHVYPKFGTKPTYGQAMHEFYRFSVRFRGVKRLKPIIAALNMYNNGDFHCIKYKTGDREYSSYEPKALKLLLQILNIPHHRELLIERTPDCAQCKAA